MWKFKNLVYARGNSYNLSVQGFINPFQKRFWQINGKIRWLRNLLGHSTHAARCCVPFAQFANERRCGKIHARGEKNRQTAGRRNFTQRCGRAQEDYSKEYKVAERNVCLTEKYLIQLLNKGSSSPQWKSLARKIVWPRVHVRSQERSNKR